MLLQLGSLELSAFRPRDPREVPFYLLDQVSLEVGFSSDSALMCTLGRYIQEETRLAKPVTSQHPKYQDF